MYEFTQIKRANLNFIKYIRVACRVENDNSVFLAIFKSRLIWDESQKN